MHEYGGSLGVKGFILSGTGGSPVFLLNLVETCAGSLCEKRKISQNASSRDFFFAIIMPNALKNGRPMTVKQRQRNGG
jgi:hypothetical protein